MLHKHSNILFFDLHFYKINILCNFSMNELGIYF